MAIIMESRLVDWIESAFGSGGKTIASCTVMLCQDGSHNKIYATVKVKESTGFTVYGCWGRNGKYPLNQQAKIEGATEAKADMMVKSLLNQKQAKGYRVFATGVKSVSNPMEVLKFQQEAVALVDRLLNTM